MSVGSSQLRVALGSSVSSLVSAEACFKVLLEESRLTSIWGWFGFTTQVCWLQGVHPMPPAITGEDPRAAQSLNIFPC